MVLMKPGVWHDTVWADRTWTEDLWLEYGAAAPPSPTPRGGTAWFPPYPRPKRPNFIEDNREALEKFAKFLRWRLGISDYLPVDAEE